MSTKFLYFYSFMIAGGVFSQMHNFSLFLWILVFSAPRIPVFLYPCIQHNHFIFWYNYALFFTAKQNAAAT